MGRYRKVLGGMKHDTAKDYGLKKLRGVCILQTVQKQLAYEIYLLYLGSYGGERVR